MKGKKILKAMKSFPKYKPNKDGWYLCQVYHPDMSDKYLQVCEGTEDGDFDTYGVMKFLFLKKL
jgi:hypothetical protein